MSGPHHGGQRSGRGQRVTIEPTSSSGEQSAKVELGGFHADTLEKRDFSALQSIPLLSLLK